MSHNYDIEVHGLHSQSFINDIELNSYFKLNIFFFICSAELKLRHDFEEKQREENVAPGKLQERNMCVV